MPDNINLPGLIPDTRSLLDISKDYTHEEVAPQAVILKWNRGIEDCPIYSVRDQNGSGSCVSQAIAKALEIITGQVQSAHPIYRRRANFPNMGMYLQDGGNILRHLGTTAESLDPSQRMSELEMNKDIFVDTPLKETIYITADFKDIDTIATAIEVYKHCIITFNGNIDEYAPFEKPQVRMGSTLNCAHAICGIYYFTDENGEKCIVLDESWGAVHTRRIFTETYLKARATGAMYFIPLNPTPTPKPKFNFTTPLSYGQNNYSIKALQDILKYENLFPQNVASSGYYGEISRKAILQWQKAHQVANLSELEALQGRRVGEKTIKALNSIYN